MSLLVQYNLSVRLNFSGWGMETEKKGEGIANRKVSIHLSNSYRSLHTPLSLKSLKITEH